MLEGAMLKMLLAGGVIFGVEPYKSSLEKVIRRYGIETLWHQPPGRGIGELLCERHSSDRYHRYQLP